MLSSVAAAQVAAWAAWPGASAVLGRAAAVFWEERTALRSPTAAAGMPELEGGLTGDLLLPRRAAPPSVADAALLGQDLFRVSAPAWLPPAMRATSIIFSAPVVVEDGGGAASEATVPRPNLDTRQLSATMASLLGMM